MHSAGIGVILFNAVNNNNGNKAQAVDVNSLEYLANVTIINDVTDSFRFTVEITANNIQFPIRVPAVFPRSLARV